MHWFSIVTILVLLVAVVWVVSQKNPVEQAQNKVAILAARVGGSARGLSVQLLYNHLPAEGAVIEERIWQREGQVSRVNRQFVWSVRLHTAGGSRTAYYPMASSETVPEPDEFLAQLGRLAEAQHQG